VIEISAGAEFRHAQVDVTDEGAVRDLFQSLARWITYWRRPLRGLRPGDSSARPSPRPGRSLDSKLFGSWVRARYTAPRMRPGGSITFLTGCAAIRPRAGLSMVTATFAALEALSHALALSARGSNRPYAEEVPEPVHQRPAL